MSSPDQASLFKANAHAMCHTSAVKPSNEGDDDDDDGGGGGGGGGRAPLRRTVPIRKRAKIDLMHVVFLQVASHPPAYFVSYLPRGVQCNAPYGITHAACQVVCSSTKRR